MLHDKLTEPIRYIAKKHGITEKQVEDAFRAQFDFARDVISKRVDKSKDYFPTIFYRNFMTFHFNEKKWKMHKNSSEDAKIRAKKREDEIDRHTEE